MEIVEIVAIIIAALILISNSILKFTTEGESKKIKYRVNILLLVLGLFALAITAYKSHSKATISKSKLKEEKERRKTDSITYENEIIFQDRTLNRLEVDIEKSNQIVELTNELNKELKRRLDLQSRLIQGQGEEVIKSRFLIDEDKLSMDIEFLFTSETLVEMFSREERPWFSLFYDDRVDELQYRGNRYMGKYMSSYLKGLQIKLDFIKGSRDNFFSLLSDTDLVLNCEGVESNSERKYTIHIAPTRYFDGVFVYITNIPLNVLSKNYTFQVLQSFSENTMTVGIVSDSLKPHQENILEPPNDQPNYLALPFFEDLITSPDVVYCLLTSIKMHHKYNTVVYEDRFDKSNKRRLIGHFVSNDYELLLQDSLTKKQ